MILDEKLASIRTAFDLERRSADSETAMTIINLATHPEAYVTVRELADYWQVSRRVIYKQIEAGTLDSIRLGPRLLRIRTEVAREFELAARMRPGDRIAGDSELRPASRVKARARQK